MKLYIVHFKGKNSNHIRRKFVQELRNICDNYLI